MKILLKILIFLFVLYFTNYNVLKSQNISPQPQKIEKSNKKFTFFSGGNIDLNLGGGSQNIQASANVIKFIIANKIPLYLISGASTETTKEKINGSAFSQIFSPTGGVVNISVEGNDMELFKVDDNNYLNLYYLANYKGIIGNDTNNSLNGLSNFGSASIGLYAQFDAELTSATTSDKGYLYLLPTFSFATSSKETMEELFGNGVSSFQPYFTFNAGINIPNVFSLKIAFSTLFKDFSDYKKSSFKVGLGFNVK